ncbi:dephospho-CoA kinase [Flavobacterium ammoniigenes]|jgi:dephospho-CoA kinase|uniref:Dephospho-CoA kinase n=1 Tax=Flavobacterium ammoniigenes TaxID=1751095 RepID=A0ABM7V6K7_9FLAO|nr:dephospho-CoA kinase [Flavobacterium ammoniigenes]BDB55195.1 dephospho-CoA kinase [Flavobacterium ammoniigenes]
MAVIIGLTGGIGSGKTTLVNYMESLGIPVFIADEEAKKAMQSPQVLDNVKANFGNAIFENGHLNRQQLASIVFSNPDKLKELNSIIHPEVKRQFAIWLDQHKTVPFVVYEAAILFESGSYQNCDYIITVTAPLEDRITRVMQRDNCSREQVLQRINVQWTDEERALKSNYVIDNTSTQSAKHEIDKILKILKN